MRDDRGRLVLETDVIVDDEKWGAKTARTCALRWPVTGDELPDWSDVDRLDARDVIASTYARVAWSREKPRAEEVVTYTAEVVVPSGQSAPKAGAKGAGEAGGDAR